MRRESFTAPNTDDIGMFALSRSTPCVHPATKSVTTKATTRGSFKVYVYGVLKATVSAFSSTTKFRQDVYQFSWSTAGTHKIKIVVSGTSGHPRVDVDAFLAIK